MKLSPKIYGAVNWRKSGLLATYIAVALAFSGWSLTFPVIPFEILRSGGSGAAAGAATASFMMASVAVQPLTTKLISQWGYRSVMFIASMILGLPSILYLLGNDAVLVIAISVCRGAGFGLLSVTESALIPALAPKEIRGFAVSLIGLASTLPQLVFLPLGIQIYDYLGRGLFYTTCVSLGLLSALVTLSIPPVKDDAVASSQQVFAGCLNSIIPLLMFAVFSSALGYGAANTFLPDYLASGTGSAPKISAIALFCLGGSQIIGRTFAGWMNTVRNYSKALIIGGLILVSAGISMSILQSAYQLYMLLQAVAMFLVGFGFGAVQNETLMNLFDHPKIRSRALASTLWNMAFDFGTGFGGLIVGIFICSFGFSLAFGTLLLFPVLALLGLASAFLRSANASHKS